MNAGGACVCVYILKKNEKVREQKAVRVRPPRPRSRQLSGTRAQEGGGARAMRSTRALVRLRERAEGVRGRRGERQGKAIGL